MVFKFHWLKKLIYSKTINNWFNTAGNNSSIGSLSSLTTSGGSDVDFDFLNDYGTKFRRLADLYGVSE